jgi:hypothetical protein
MSVSVHCEMGASRLRRAYLATLPVLTAALSAACSSDDYVCTLGVEPAVVVTVWDARTHAPAPPGATGLLREGTYVDTLRRAGGGDAEYWLAGAYERPGTYAVGVRLAGYREWTAGRVRVTGDRCGVVTQRLVAELTPEC